MERAVRAASALALPLVSQSRTISATGAAPLRGGPAGNKDQAMTIERTAFGSITVDGKTYDHDVIIRLSGEVVKRKKKLSKKYYGTSHVISKDEAKFVLEKGCKQLILGCGQMGNVHLSPEAQVYFDEKGCEVLLLPTLEAILRFNGSHARKAGLFHVTC
jgi:hypothetical protein